MQYHQMFAVVGVIALSAVFHAPARAQTRQAELEGFQEVPVVSTTGEGRCRVKISSDHTMIEAEISFSNLQGNVTQAHIHLGQKDVNGGVAVFFCSNLPIGKTHQDVDFGVPRVACYPCVSVALADKPPVAPKQRVFL